MTSVAPDHDDLRRPALGVVRDHPAHPPPVGLQERRLGRNGGLSRLGRGPIEDLLPRFDEEGRWVDSPARWHIPTDAVLERRETRVLIRSAIERLPVNYRAVLLLRDIEELDTHETASLLGITPEAVKTRLHRARQALRTLLEQELPGRERGNGTAARPSGRPA